MSAHKKHQTLKRILIGVLIVVLLLPIGVLLFFHVPAVNVDAYFEDSDTVRVIETKKYYFFDSPETESVLFFYQGAKIDERAYAPILRMVAEAGIDVYCFHMPLYLSFFDLDRPDSLIDETTYSKVLVGGHSLGGAMAARYVYHTDRAVRGLALFGAYSDVDLTDKEGLSVFSTYGTRDEILNRKRYASFKSNLPSGDRFTEVIVENGNHSRCASYGDVFENASSVIPYEEQWRIMSSSLIAWVDTL